MTLVLGNAGPAAGQLVSSPTSSSELRLLGPHARPFCSESDKFQQRLGGLVGACSGSHLCPILVHLARPGQALLLLKTFWEFTKPAGNAAAPLPQRRGCSDPSSTWPPQTRPSCLTPSTHLLFPVCSFPLKGWKTCFSVALAMTSVSLL